MKSPEAILIIRPSALGDVCRSVPVLASLRRAYPAARIDWLVRDAFVPAIEHHAGLTGVVPFERGRMGKQLKRGQVGPARGLLKRLREADYDLVLDCQGLARSGLFAWATRSPRRIGYARPEAREGAWLAYTTRVRVRPGMHAVDRMLELVRAAGVEPVASMRLYTGWKEREEVRADPKLGGAEGGYAVIAPTSVWPGKRWPAERFAALAEAILGMGVGSVVLVGAAHERGQCGPLLELAAREPRVADRIGGTTVGQLMAVIEGSRLVVANDSAALHMAVGFGRSIVALFGPTRVGLVGPYGREGDVIQHVQEGERLDHKDGAAGRALMERISVEEVAAAVGERLGAETGG